jgi:beta-lactamase class D
MESPNRSAAWSLGLTAFAALSALACAPALPAAKPVAASAPAAPGSASAGPANAAPVIVTDATRLTELPIVERPDLLEAFDAEGVIGTIALFDSSTGVLTCGDAERCRRPHIPASTFKIANSLIALETGVVSDAETVLPWDGKTYSIADWNQDMNLRTALRVSCVPCFQGIARKVGDLAMRDWVKRLGYGNQDTSGGIDRFWLSGGLRVTPVQQLDFVRRLELGKLPVRELTREIVIDMLALDVTEQFVLRGKTGYGRPPDETELIGWFVGWIERGPRRVYFATALDGHKDGVDFVKVRRRVTEAVLTKLGLLP